MWVFLFYFHKSTSVIKALYTTVKQMIIRFNTTSIPELLDEFQNEINTIDYRLKAELVLIDKTLVYTYIQLTDLTTNPTNSIVLGGSKDSVKNHISQTKYLV